MTSLPKTMAEFGPLQNQTIKHRIYRSIYKNFGSFYHAHLPNMVMSRDPRCKFRIFFYFALILHLISRKVTNFPWKSSLLQKLSAKNLMGGGGTSHPMPLRLTLHFQAQSAEGKGFVKNLMHKIFFNEEL